MLSGQNKGLLLFHDNSFIVVVFTTTYAVGYINIGLNISDQTESVRLLARVWKVWLEPLPPWTSARPCRLHGTEPESPSKGLVGPGTPAGNFELYTLNG